MAAERLAKILAAAGVASRRESEKLIAAGRVMVAGEVVTDLARKVDARRERVTLDGVPIRPARTRTYLLLYKPKGYVSTLSDPQGRPTVRDLLPPEAPRLVHVGRLDLMSEGLLIMTDDGDFAQQVAHPRHGCEKVYLVKVSGVPTGRALAQLRRGVALDGVRTAPIKADIVRTTRRDGNAWLALTLREGRSRQIRRMLQAVGHPVSKLRRTRIGPIGDRGLKPGSYRRLRPAEIDALRGDAADAPPPRRPGRGRRTGRPRRAR